MKGKKEQNDSTGKSADNIDINDLILSSRKISSINSEVLKKLEENEQIADRLAKEVERLRNKDAARESGEIEGKNATIIRLTDELRQTRERFLIAEASSRKRSGEADIFVHQNEQLKKGNESLLKAFSKIKSEHLAISEAVTAAERELQQKVKENDLLKTSLQKAREERDSAKQLLEAGKTDAEKKELMIKLASANKKLAMSEYVLDETNKKINYLMEENQKLKSGVVSVVEISKREKEDNLIQVKKIIAKKDEENLLLMKRIRTAEVVLENKNSEIEELSDESKIAAERGERKNMAIQLLKERSDIGNFKKEIKIKDILIEKLKRETSQLKEGYMNELHNRKILDEYGEKIDSLRRQLLGSQKALNEKERIVKALEEEKKVLKEELEIEMTSKKAENLVEQFDSVRRENTELRMLMQQEKDNVSKMTEYHSKLIEMQKTEYDDRINNIIARGTEKEVELNSIMESLGRTIEEKNAKLEHQKDFYLDIQRRIRQNILDSGIILEEEKSRETHKKAILDFLLRKGAKSEKPKTAAKEAANAKPAFIEEKNVFLNNTINNTGRETKKMEMPPTPIPLGVKMAGQPAKDDKTEEIMSVIIIAKQHGDNDGQIKASLANSGYESISIERAFSLIKNK